MFAATGDVADLPKNQRQFHLLTLVFGITVRGIS
jgi:hypothetical protein